MSQIQATLDHLFRRESGRIVAYLTRYLGSNNLDLAENVVQEALLRAVQTWPLQGIPENPSAWILRTAKNIAIDHVRREKKLSFEIDFDELESEEDERSFEKEISDDQLKLMFICCHPRLSRESQLALTLKTLCGFSVKEVAKAFLAKEETIAQRIVRAKQKISEEKMKYEVPGPKEIAGRLESVLEVLYLLFNEGYSATEGDALFRKDLCDEAIYRTTLLAIHPVCKSPKILALLSLMHLQASRFNSRLDTNGELLLLEEQNRSLWDFEHIQKGLYYLELSAEGEDLTEYHLQAGIASCHALAPTFEETDWERVLTYYDLLLMKAHSPVVALNRCVALAMAKGFDEGLKETEALKETPTLKNYYLLPATIAELNRRLGKLEIAKSYYEKALNLVGTTPEKRLIEKRIKSCQ
jgi:RNA polymerase sigma-70 factor (ECF subfamily)